MRKAERISEKDKCVAAYTQFFVERVFNGAAGAMVAAFIKQKRLSDREIAEQRAILDDMGTPSWERGRPRLHSND